jgi:hypothetical protein
MSECSDDFNSEKAYKDKYDSFVKNDMHADLKNKTKLESPEAK